MSVKLVSADQEVFLVDKKIAKQSLLIKDMLEERNEGGEIPLQNVDAVTLKKVIEYMEYYHDKTPQPIPKPLTTFKENVSSWDYKYTDLDTNLLINIIMAANYLNIPSLLELIAAKIASYIKGKSPEEIRNVFGIENDFSPEEEQKN